MAVACVATYYLSHCKQSPWYWFQFHLLLLLHMLLLGFLELLSLLQQYSLWNTKLDNPEATEGAELSRSCRTATAEVLVMHNLYWNHYIGFQLRNSLTSNWQLWHSRYRLLSSTRPLLQAPRIRTAYGSRAFSSAVLANWNNLPTSVIKASSLSVFRCRLKTRLFTVAFEVSG